MKKIILIMLSAAFIFQSAACSSAKVEQPQETEVVQTTAPTVEAYTDEPVTESEETETKVLSEVSSSFSDIDGSEWFAENVSQMASQGILSGYSDGTFKPQSTITYAEFCTIIKRIVTGSAEKSSSGHWAKQTMEYALSKVWYDYDEINESKYDTPIPRYMAVKILALGMDIPKTENDEGVYWRYMNEIKDFNSINGRYAYLVVRAYNNGILTGDNNGNFNPDSSLTRAEACAIISRASGLADINVSENTNQTSQQNPSSPQTTQQTENPQVPTEVTVRTGGVSENGKLQVIGTQLCNERGEPIQLRGMSTHGLQWFSNFTGRDSIAYTAERGANLFRIAMYTAENGYISDKDGIKAKLIEAVNNAISEDMYVIIDWHILYDSNPMTYVEEAKAFFDEISRLYADSPNVIYEICNEPNGGATWDNDIKPYAETVIPVIRANDADSVILVGNSTWSQDVDKCADNPLAFENIMYTCHFYAGTHGQWLRDRIDYALQKGAPIFVSEWGTSAADGNGGVFLNEAGDWMKFLNERSISWANWSLCDKAETSAALNPNALNDGLTDSDLTESGKFVFSNFK